VLGDNRRMTFPLGSLRGAPDAGAAPTAPLRLRSQLLLIAGSITWLLALLAMLTHHAGDPGFSTSGDGEALRNWVGLAGAWGSDFLLFMFGHSAWWLLVVGARVGLASLARQLRGQPAPDDVGATARLWFGVAVLLAASCALEWTRLYRFESLLPGHAGGVLGYTLGPLSMKWLGFAGSGVLWIAALVVGASLALRFSWLRVAEAFGGWAESLRERRQERIERAEDVRLGLEAQRERDQRAEVERQLVEDHLPIVIESPLVDVPKSERVAKERQKPLFSELADTKLPQVDLLDAPTARQESVTPETLEMTSRLIEKKLKDFGVEVRVVAASPGPVITRYEIEPATGVKGAQIVNLAKDLARSLSLVSIRVVETIPGKTTMALELPNAKRQTIRLAEILGSQVYNDAASMLTLGLGKDIIGAPVVADLAKMPHCLVAGTTGAGKSVGINAMILSLLYKAEARDVRVIFIDPKMLEMSVYEGIPHLLCPVVTDMKQAANALNWCVGEMERRYKLMSKLGVRNLAGYNRKLEGRAHRQPVQPDARTTRAARTTAACRGRDRRTCRPDDGGRQENRGADRAPGTEGARCRHPSDPGDAAAERGCDHRPDQGQHPDPPVIPGVEQDRLAHDPRPDGRRSAARPGRHAVPAAGRRLAGAGAWCLRQRRGSAPRRRLPQGPGRAELHRRHPRRWNPGR
jgi:S-DNA-T family DNA segregation ATPase FtsK/SpoIIIE